MNLAEKEYHQRKETKEIKKAKEVIRNTTTPVWFNKDIEAQPMTEEEIKAFEELLKGND